MGRVLLYRQRIAARCRLALVFYKVPSMGCRSACKVCRKYAHQVFFSADAPCTGSGAPPGFIGFFPEVSRQLRPGVHADDMTFGIRLRLETLLAFAVSSCP